MVEKDTLLSVSASKKSRLPNATPMLEKVFIRKYLSPKQEDNPLMYTYYKEILAQYCIPDMYYVCPFCLFITDNERTMEDHYKGCKDSKICHK